MKRRSSRNRGRSALAPQKQGWTKSWKGRAVLGAIVFVVIFALASTADDTDSPGSTEPTDQAQAQSTSEPTQEPQPTEEPTEQPVAETLHELDGEVLIMEEVNFTIDGDSCQGTGEFADVVPGAMITIKPKDKEAITAELGEGTLSPEGNCRLAFTPEIPEADEYVFQIGDHVNTKQMDIIAFPDGWWASVQYD